MTDRRNTGLIFDLKRFALHDGPGIRLTVFMKGCPLECWWCHNPEGIVAGVQVVSKENRVGDRVLQTDEAVGRQISIDELVSELEKEIIFFDESGGGVTFSGGEPLMQMAFLEEALVRCRELDIHTTLDTCGYASFDKFERIEEHVDLILYDLKIMDQAKHKQFTGVSNQLILENLVRLSHLKPDLRVRIPVIPGITDTEENTRDMIGFLKTIKKVNQVDLLPFHNMASGKYQRFEIHNRLTQEKSLTREELIPLKIEFENHGFNVTIGE